MEERYSIQRLLALRKLTRAMADYLRGQMKEYLSTLSPLFRPKAVLGNYVEGGAYEVSRIGEKAFKELQEAYQALAKSKPYNLPPDFKTPLEIISTQLEMTPVEYTYVASGGGESKTVVVTSPLKWVLTFSGFSPARLRELIASKNRTGDALQQAVLHYLMMNTMVTKQAGLAQMMDALHFSLSTERLKEFGDLPVTYISAAISTTRPPDEVIIESTEVSGMNVFEEVVETEDVARLRDPLKERLVELMKTYGEETPNH
ncbi:MAG TPA: hypothetical protein VK619_12825 [Pyrinomonadaceae bacterium]|nr:hypothetical protein [Pyrinomonadaceae bacterium]